MRIISTLPRGKYVLGQEIDSEALVAAVEYACLKAKTSVLADSGVGHVGKLLTAGAEIHPKGSFDLANTTHLWEPLSNSYAKLIPIHGN